MIGWYVHDHGSGHRGRLEAVAPHLDVPVTGMGSGPPAAGVDWLPLPPDTLGPAADDPTAGGALHWSPLGERGMLSRAETVAAWVRASGCRLLVVDVSVEMLLLARLLGVATVAVLQPGRREDRAHLLGYDTAAALLAPWPAALPTRGRWLAGLGRRDTPLQARTTHTGAFSVADRRAPAESLGCALPGRCVALVLGRGGHGVTVPDVRAAAAATPGWHWHVAGELAPGAGGSVPWSSVVEHGTLPDVRALLAHADVVVGPCGGGLVAEVAASGTPFLALPQPRPFDEQVELAALLDRAGLAEVARSWPSARAWPGLLERLHATAADAPRFWSRWADGGGAARAARLVEQVHASRTTAEAQVAR